VILDIKFSTLLQNTRVFSESFSYHYDIKPGLLLIPPCPPPPPSTPPPPPPPPLNLHYELIFHPILADLRAQPELLHTCSLASDFVPLPRPNMSNVCIFPLFSSSTILQTSLFEVDITFPDRASPIPTLLP